MYIVDLQNKIDNLKNKLEEELENIPGYFGYDECQGSYCVGKKVLGPCIRVVFSTVRPKKELLVSVMNLFQHYYSSTISWHHHSRYGFANFPTIKSQLILTIDKVN